MSENYPCVICACYCKARGENEHKDKCIYCAEMVELKADPVVMYVASNILHRLKGIEEGIYETSN